MPSKIHPRFRPRLLENLRQTSVEFVRRPDVDRLTEELRVLKKAHLEFCPAHRMSKVVQALRRLGVVAQRGDVEMLQDAKHHAAESALTLGWTELDDLVAVVVESQRLLPPWRRGHQVLHLDPPPHPIARLDEVLRPLPFGEVLGPFVSEAA